MTPAFPRRMSDGRRIPLVLLHPAHRDRFDLRARTHRLWKKAADYVKNGGVAIARSLPTLRSPNGRAFRRAQDRRDTIVRSHSESRQVVRRFKIRRYFHFTLPEAAAKYWGTGSKGRAAPSDSGRSNKGVPCLIGALARQGQDVAVAYPIEAYLVNLPMVLDGDRTAFRLLRALRLGATCNQR